MIDYPFTAVPNWFFQIAKDLKEAELRIMLEVWFQTAGKQTDTNVLAYSYIAQNTGITGTSSICAALRTLESRQLITRDARRISGQLVKVTPAKNPCLPVHILMQEESVTPAKRVSDSSKRSHVLEDSESTIQETTTWEKFTDSQKENALLLLSFGLNRITIGKLIPILDKNGRDSDYLKELWGYVASVRPENPFGYLVTLVRQNAGIATSQPLQGPVKVIKDKPYHYYDSGQLELDRHDGPAADCPICTAGVKP